MAANAAVLAAPEAHLGMNFINNPRGNYAPADLPLISVSSQNCNGLNISIAFRKHLAKIIAITSLLTNFIFLSDIRLNTSQDHIQRISKQFLNEGKRLYKLHTNSDTHQRGVGILMAADLTGDAYIFISRSRSKHFGGDIPYNDGYGK